MGVPLEVRTESVLQGEVLRRGSGHRRWPDEVKGRIVAETLVPGVLVREVAARYGLKPNHISEWRARARRGLLAVPELSGAAFVPVVMTPPPDAPEPAANGASIEIVVGDVTVRVESTASVERVAALVSALRARP